MIDAHVHIWRLAAPEFEWPGPELPPIYRDFSLSDFWTASAASGTDRAVLVQSQLDQRDTEWLLTVAASDPRVLGVVGWADLLAMDAASRIRALAANPCLLGLRPMLQDLPSGWILNPDLDPAIEAMIQADLRFDALIRPRHLAALHAFARRWPDLIIVIDHGAKPEIATRSFQAWSEAIAPLAELPNVWCKLSGLLTERTSNQPEEDITPYVERLLDTFGPKRLMWGSDWPVLSLASDYDGWAELARRVVRSHSAQAETQVFGQTAHTFYGARRQPTAAQSAANAV